MNFLMGRNHFVFGALAALFVLSLTPNLAMRLGRGRGVTAGCAAMAAAWLLLWLRLGALGMRREVSLLGVLPFAPALLSAAASPDPEGSVSSPPAWLHVLSLAAAAITVIPCLRNLPCKERESAYDGTFVLLSILTAATAAMESVRLLFPA